MQQAGKPKTLRPDQKLACLTLRNAARWVLNQPTASGKTLISMAVCWEYLASHPTHLVIIAVPQTQIGEGFLAQADGSNSFFLPDGTLVDWNIGNNLISGSLTGKVKRLLGCLRGRRLQDPVQRIVVCTQQTLLAAVKQEPGLFRNLLLVIDEAHHVQIDADSRNSEIAALLDRTNALGRLIETAINKPQYGLSVGLATATFFRGDLHGIVGSHLDSFVMHKMDWADFMDTCCKYLRELSYDYMLYQDSWVGVIDEAWRLNPDAKMIVYIPPVQSACSGQRAGVGKKKLQDVQAVWQGVSGKLHPEIKLEGPVTLIRRGNRWLRFVDLVDDATDREAKKQYINAAHRGEVELDGIVCLGMFKEGANWQQASVAVIIGPRASLTEIVQMIGRLMRDFYGKECVTIYHALPEEQENQGESYRASRIKAITAAMVLEELFCPVMVRGRTGRSRPKRTSRLRELTDNDLNLVASIQQSINEQLIMQQDPDEPYTRGLLTAVTASVLKDRLGVTNSEDIRLVSAQVRGLLARHHPNRAKLERLISTDEFDAVEAELFGDGFLSYSIDAPSLRRWREILWERRKNWFPRFWSYLVEYLLRQYNYQLCRSAIALGSVPPATPVALVRPSGQQCNMSVQAVARKHQTKKLLIPADYVSPDGYALGILAMKVRTKQKEITPIQREWLEAINFSFELLQHRTSVAEIKAYVASQNLEILGSLSGESMDEITASTWVRCRCLRCLYEYSVQYSTMRQIAQTGQSQCARCRVS